MKSKLQYPHCIICGDNYLSDTLGYLRCSSCSLISSGQKAGYGNIIQGMSAISYANYKIVVNALAKFMDLHESNILDVGSAEGGFTELILQKGGSALGLEPDKAAAQEAIKKNLPLNLVSFEDFKNSEKQFDAIVFNDVFEHMQNPISILKKSRHILKDNGLILINIPVSSGFIFNTVRTAAQIGFETPYRRIWAEGLSSPHIYFYNEKNLKNLFLQHNFTLIDKGPLIALSAKGMYKRVRSTFGPISALIISFIATMFVLVSNFFPSDVKYLIFKKRG